jgi:hypothetical protein
MHSGYGTFLQYRPAFHGLLDLEAGMLPYSRLSLLDTKAGIATVHGKTRFRLQELDIASVEQYAPSTELDFQPAWVLGGRLIRFNDPDNFDHLGFRFQAGYGTSHEQTFQELRVLVYGMGKGAIDAFGFRNLARLRPSVSAGVVFTYGKFRLWNDAETSIRFPGKSSWVLQLESRASYAVSRNLQISGVLSHTRGDNRFRSHVATGAISWFY